MAEPSARAGATPGLMTRVVSGLRYAVTGTAPGVWFGPAAPIAPAAPSAAGRQFDYPVGFNLRVAPREDAAIGFAELRMLAERWDLLRLVIETRKDQIASLDWAIRPRRARIGGMAMAPLDDPRLLWLEDFFADPDREHGWAGWLRMILEDLFVIDAPTLYVRRGADGGLWALEVVDGATVKRVLGADGRTPHPPDPAYQQVLKGVPAVDYTADDLIYQPRNPRPHRVYGFSPVEQIVMTANIALRRQVSQLNYFTEGNTPEALIGVPDSWTPEQIRQFQEYWDALLQGNLAARRHTRFVPGGLHYQPTRDAPLKDDFDEWLARIVCFAFSIPATAFASQVNRATAETAQQAALAEGLAPLQIWLKGLIDRVIRQVLGWNDLEFVWADGQSADPEAQAETHIAYVGAGVKTRNEVRALIGLGPLPDGDTATTAGPTAPLPPATPIAKRYDPGQPRGDDGRWTAEGGGLTQVAEGEGDAPDEGIEPKIEDEPAKIKNELWHAEMGTDPNAAQILEPPFIGVPPVGVPSTANPGISDDSAALPLHVRAAQLPRPAGLPPNFTVRPSKDGDGVIYQNPSNAGDHLRVMLAKPKDKYASRHVPYVVHNQNGSRRDINGNPVEKKTAESHIPLSDYVYRPPAPTKGSPKIKKQESVMEEDSEMEEDSMLSSRILYLIEYIIEMSSLKCQIAWTQGRLPGYVESIESIYSDSNLEALLAGEWRDEGLSEAQWMALKNFDAVLDPTIHTYYDMREEDIIHTPDMARVRAAGRAALLHFPDEIAVLAARDPDDPLYVPDDIYPEAGDTP